MNPSATSPKSASRMRVVVTATETVPAPVLADFTKIYDLYHASILRFCLWKCRDKESGQDIAQQVFLRFYLCLQRKEKVVLARAFLYRMARNLIIDHWRKKTEQSLDQLVEKGFEPFVDTWQQTYDRLESEKWVHKMNTLPDQYRRVLHCRFVQGMYPADIGKLLGKNSNMVSVCIHRGLKQLRA